MLNPVSSVAPTSIDQLTEHTFRHEYGRLVANLSRRFGIRLLEDIEDAVQSALLKAMHSWPRQGLPPDPSAWLHRTASNLLIDKLRRQRTWNRIEKDLQYQHEESLPEAKAEMDHRMDDQLRMLFVSCHPSLGTEAQITFALKTLCGFSVPEIAHALLTSQASIQKRLTRAKDTLREESLNPDSITDRELVERLPAVQTILYLLFNEGYNSHHPEALIRMDLCEEAVRLTQFLIQYQPTATHDSQALFALMLLHAGRLQTRLNAAGNLVLLDEQDRSQWDWSLIRTGFSWLERAASGNILSKYHLEAAIAAEHCQALTFDETNWKVIEDCYALLYRMEPTAIHALNRAIAMAYLHGPQAGIAWLNQCYPDGAPAGYHHWPAAVGELYRRKGDSVTALKYFDQALSMSPPPAEKAFLEMRRQQCMGNSK